MLCQRKLWLDRAAQSQSTNNNADGAGPVCDGANFTHASPFLGIAGHDGFCEGRDAKAH
jgi:hypothetical protein